MGRNIRLVALKQGFQVGWCNVAVAAYPQQLSQAVDRDIHIQLLHVTALEQVSLFLSFS